jgi:hypothetical protein
MTDPSARPPHLGGLVEPPTATGLGQDLDDPGSLELANAPA